MILQSMSHTDNHNNFSDTMNALMLTTAHIKDSMIKLP